MQTASESAISAAVGGLIAGNGSIINPVLTGDIPPQPTEFAATGAFNSIMLTWNDHSYRYLSYAEVYRAEVNDFTFAVKIGSTTASMYADTPPDSALAVTYYYWVRLVSVANVYGPLSDVAYAATANDPAYILGLLTGQITGTQLHSDLTGLIAKIPGLEISTDAALSLLNTAGESILQTVLAQRTATEATYREQFDRAQDVLSARTEAANALLTASQSLTTKIADEATARSVSLAAEASTRAAAFTAETAARVQAIIDEAIARGYAVQEAKDATTTLAITMLGADGTSYNSGLVYEERFARTSATDALAQSISLLSAGVDGGFDPANRWEFDADVMGWLSSGCTLTWDGGWLMQASVSATPAQAYIAGISVQGSKYATVKFRMKRVSGSGWGVSVDYQISGGAWTAGKTADLQAASIGGVVVCAVDFSDVSAWKNGTITGIRINTGESTGDAWSFDWIMTGRQAPGVSTATLSEEKTALATLISAEVTARQLLDAKLYGADGTATTSGTLYNERAARATAEGVIVSSVESLEAKVYNPDTGAVAQSTAFQGLYSSVTDGINGLVATAEKAELLRAQINDGEQSVAAQIASLQTASASSVEAMASDVTTLFAGFNSAGEAMLEGVLGFDALQGTFAAMIQQEAFARADADGAESEQRSLLRAKIDDVEAGVMIEQTARVTALEAEAINRAIMGAQIEDSMSALSQTQSVTASALESTASTVTELAARVDDNTASLLNEQTVRATQDEAIALSVTTLTADLGDTAAMIQEEMVARADADSAEAGYRLALAAIVADNTAAITHEETVRAEQDRSILSTVDIYGVTYGEAALQTVLAGESSIGVIAAYIKQARDAIASAELAMAEQTQYLQAQIDDNFAGLLEERRVTSDLVSAVASSVDSLAVVFDGNLAALQESLTVQASALGTEAVARETLAASFVTGQGELNAAIQNESVTRANALAAEAEQRLLITSSVADNLAFIENNYYTKTTADEAVATSTGGLRAMILDDTTNPPQVHTSALSNYYTKTEVNTTSALAVSVNTLSASLAPGGATYQSVQTAQSTANSGVADAATASLAASAAQGSATAANNSLSDIANDNLLTPGEKPVVIAQRDAILAEQTGINSEADRYLIVAEKATYTSAVSDLTGYLAGLTAPVAWNVLTGNTTIVGVTFRAKFNNVYAARQVLLNKIYQKAKETADAAQSTASGAVSTFTNFQTNIYAADQTSLQNQIDGKVEAWFQPAASDPATAWADASTKAKHVGDSWFKTDTKKLYYYNSSYVWTLVEDQKAIDAYTNAAAAQTTANSKITTFTKAGVPTSGSPAATAIGDLCIDSAANNQVYRWSGTAWIGVFDTRISTLVTDVATLQTYDANNTISMQEIKAVSNITGAPDYNPAKTYKLNELAAYGTGLARKVYRANVAITVAEAWTVGHWTEMVNGPFAEYVLKTDVNGKIAGFGLSNDGASSTFEIVADKFAIASSSTDPNAADGCPFFHLTVPTVVDGVTIPSGTYIKKANIVDLTATNIRVGSVSADRLDVTQLSAIAADLGTMNAGTVNGVTINGTTINGGTVNGTVITGGTFQTTNGKIVITGETLTVYDLAGTVRVKLGFLG